MKKFFLVLAVLMISANSFAWKGYFQNSCGGGHMIDYSSGDIPFVSLTAYLQYVNYMECGDYDVTITFH